MAGDLPFMKSILLAAFLTLVATLSTRADIPAPHPTQLVVTNLSAFPKFKFGISFVTNPSAQPVPLEEKKVYEVNSFAQLYVQDAHSKPRAWATVEYRPGVRAVRIVVKDVTHGSKGIEVSYDKDDGTPKKSAARAADAWPHFLLAGLGCCGLVLLAPRVRRKGAL